MIKVGIVGGTGYTGVELLRLLAAHPAVELSVITSRAETGIAVADFFPNLRGHIDLAFTSPDSAALAACDVVFFATPNGIAMTQARELLAAGVRVIDLAADFRLRDVTTWQHWYGSADVKHACPELLQEAVYGLPEVNRAAIRTARLVANPGCYPTAVQLGLLPLVEQGLVDIKHLIANAASGISGAGRKAEVGTLFSERAEQFRAYAVSGHRHLPEIMQGLTRAAGQAALAHPCAHSTGASCPADVGLTFVPHYLPIVRGIHATLYGVLNDKSLNLQEIYEKRYASEPFVDVLLAGAHPETRSVKGANTCRLAVHRPQEGDTVVVLSVIDNLVKGAAGQAVQNMNIMFNQHETTGLNAIALLP